MANLPFKDRSELYAFIQDHMAEGTLLVVGSGLSVAEGLPSMKDLADGLIRSVVPEADESWQDVKNSLASGVDLETALLRINIQPQTLDQVVRITASLVRDAESKTLVRVLANERMLPLTSLLTHLFKAGKVFHCLTSNYDRLVELAGEFAKIGVDTGFWGAYLGHFDRSRSVEANRKHVGNARSYTYEQLPTLKVYKPHGSLDWIEIGGTVVRSQLRVVDSPMIITPGIAKYRESLKPIFEEQRIAGNHAIDRAKRYLILGYGFNDDHLQQYLCPGGRFSKPTVILTKGLTCSAKKMIASSIGSNVIGIHQSVSDQNGAEVIGPSDFKMEIDAPIWSIDALIKEVLS